MALPPSKLTSIFYEIKCAPIATDSPLIQLARYVGGGMAMPPGPKVTQADPDARFVPGRYAERHAVASTITRNSDQLHTQLAAFLRTEVPGASDADIEKAAGAIHAACVVYLTLSENAERSLFEVVPIAPDRWERRAAPARKAPPFAESVSHLEWAARMSDEVWHSAWLTAPPQLLGMIEVAAGSAGTIGRAIKAHPVKARPPLPVAPPRDTILAFLPPMPAAPPRDAVLALLPTVRAMMDRGKGGRPRNWQRDAAAAAVLKAVSGLTGMRLPKNATGGGSSPIVSWLEGVSAIYVPGDGDRLFQVAASSKSLGRILKSLSNTQQ
ncbi:hypothetical protein ACLBXM_13730 [Xanthobacteraceae bacterium A53D]